VLRGSYQPPFAVKISDNRGPNVARCVICDKCQLGAFWQTRRIFCMSINRLSVGTRKSWKIPHHKSSPPFLNQSSEQRFLALFVSSNLTQKQRKLGPAECVLLKKCTATFNGTTTGKTINSVGAACWKKRAFDTAGWRGHGVSPSGPTGKNPNRPSRN